MKPKQKTEKPKRASALETKQKIINATLAIAATKGFEQTTTAEIAREAGVAEGSIYNHFRTKDDLLIHMVEQYASSFMRLLEEAIGEEKTATAKLKRLISFHIQFFTQEGNIFQVVFGRTPGTKVQMARVIRIVVAPYTAILQKIITEGIDRKEFRKMNPQVASSFLLGGMQLTLLRRFFDLADYTPREAVNGILELYLNGLVLK